MIDHIKGFAAAPKEAGWKASYGVSGAEVRCLTSKEVQKVKISNGVKSKKTKLSACRLPRLGIGDLRLVTSALRLAIGDWQLAILAGCLLIFAAGCENDTRAPLQDKIYTLRQEKTELTYQIKQAKTENKQLRKQIQVLSGLKPEVKLEKLYDLQRVKISRYTNLYDKNKDGKKEKLIVYIQPIDQDGDIIKAAGAVDIQLWDLNKKDGQALLGEWHISPSELKKLWFATFITINYRLTFGVADKIASFEEPLTIKVTFTDYLTGKVFKEQKVIKPR